MEYWDVYDKNGKLTGKVVEKNAEFLPGEYHKAVEIWIINDEGLLLVQKRSESVEFYPGYWGLTTGRIKSGETPESGCVRELSEELGITASESEFIHIYHAVRETLPLIWDIFVLKWNGKISDLSYRDHEVADAKWITADELRGIIAREEIFIYPELEEILDRIEKTYIKAMPKQHIKNSD